MFDQILDTYRRATESTMQLQQMMLRNWTQQWPPTMLGMGMMPNPGVALLEQAHDAQKKWSESVTDMLTKHRESLDAQYKAGIKTIEDAFRVGEARDPEHFRKLTEELWRHSFEALKSVSEDQMKEFQSAMQKWVDVAATTSGVKK